MTDTLDSPLLLDRVAKENEEKVEDDSPYYDNSTDAVNPVSKSRGENSHVEHQLAHFEGCKTPDVNQCEREGYLHDNGQIVRHCVWS